MRGEAARVRNADWLAPVGKASEGRKPAAIERPSLGWGCMAAEMYARWKGDVAFRSGNMQL